MKYNILAIGAHFDDIELGCGGSLAKFSKLGHNVYGYVATKSGFSNENSDPVRSEEVAYLEGQRAGKILGLTELFQGNFKTLSVEFDDNLNIDLLRIINQYEIDFVLCHWPGDVHHDHIAVSRSSLHSARHVPRILAYRSNWYHSESTFRGNFYVDIAQTWEIKKQAVLAHASEVNRTGLKWISFFENEALNAGQRIGVKYAESFEVIKWLDS